MRSNRRDTAILKDESLFVQMLNKYSTYWPWFIISLFICSGLAYLYVRYVPPKYEATASLIIKDEKKGYDDSKLMESLNMISTKKIIENEIEILQSRTVADNVVKRMHLYAPVFQDGKVNAVSAYLSSPISVLVFEPEKIKKTDKIPLNYNSEREIVSINGKFEGALNQWIKTPYGVLKFISNPKFTDNGSGKPFYFSLVEPREVTRKILDNLKVTPSNRLSSVISLSYRDVLPELAEDILNELITAYNNASVNEKNTLAKNTLAFIEQRLDVVGRHLDSIEQKTQQYKAGTNAVDINTQGQLFLQNVSANDQKLSEINMQLSVMNQLEDYVTSNNSNLGLLPSNLGITDPSLSQLLTSLNDAELEHEKLKKTVAENNPVLTSVTSQIEKIKPNIIENIKRQRQNLETSRDNLSATNNGYNSMLHSIPVKERQLLEISRNQNIENGIYAFLLQKKEESELSYASKIADSRVVNFAQASNVPVSPNKIVLGVVVLVCSFAFPMAFLRTREIFSKKVLYRQDVEASTSIPVIGEVAFNKSSEQLLLSETEKRSFISEVFRRIRVSLQYLGIDSGHKKIMVTSSISGEGKSFIAANLALSFAIAGKKVLLMDMDLHNPSLGRIFGKSGEKGVSDFLIGEKRPDEIIMNLPGHYNLFFAPAGILQENPSELLENGRIRDLISYVENNFDVIIIDTAPVLPVIDAYILSEFTDATLYVVRHRNTPKTIIERIDENNKINPLTNPAIIFNGVKPRGFSKNNYGYGYGYVYGYKSSQKKA